MFSPSALPWIAEPAKFAGPARDRPKVTAFLAIAGDTGIRQIVCFRWATKVHTEDVIHFAPQECILFVYQAILAEMPCAGGNQTP